MQNIVKGFDWQTVAKRSWTVWWCTFWFVLNTAAEVVPYLDDLMPRWIIGAILGGAVVLRLVPQASLFGKEEQKRVDDLNRAEAQ